MTPDHLLREQLFDHLNSLPIGPVPHAGYWQRRDFLFYLAKSGSIDHADTITYPNGWRHVAETHGMKVNENSLECESYRFGWNGWRP